MIHAHRPRRRRARDEHSEPPARLVVHPELVPAIAAATARAGRDETGGPLIGTVQHSWEGPVPTPIVAVLGTVPPGPDLNAAPVSVAMGEDGDGERAASALRWWRSVTGLELLHLGDWHKHPSGCPEPSPGDRSTACAMSRERSGPVWLVAVAVTERGGEHRTEVDGRVLRRTSDRSQMDELRFYQADPRTGLTRARLRVDGDSLPQLPALPWHVTQPGRFAAECRLLIGAGYKPALRSGVKRGRPAVELRLDRDDGPRLTVVTGPDFPYEEPVLRDEHGRAIRLRGDWSPARFIVDVVEEASRR